MQIIIEGSIAVGQTPGGGKLIQVTDAAGNIVTIPLTVEAARSIGAALSTALVVAGSGALNGLPKIPDGNGRIH